MIEERITSVRKFVERITKLRSDNPASNAEQWFFRGQKCSTWKVEPNIFRNGSLAQEHLFIDQALRQNPLEFRDCASNFEILTKLQHYGLGTRLLDVTLNPLVALFFASEPSNEYAKNANGQFSYQDHDGKVLYRLVNGCSLRDLQIRVSLEIPFTEFGREVSLEVFFDRLKDNRIISTNEYEQLVADNYAEAIRIIQISSFIVAANSNARLIQQRGAFLLSSAVNIKTRDNIKTSVLSKAKLALDKEFAGCFIIPAKDKDEIRRELDFFNVNEATLFPELEHQMRYIQDQANISLGTVEEYFQYSRHTATATTTAFRVLTKDDIADIINASLTVTDVAIREELIHSIFEQQELDWQNKDSGVSRIRRTITKVLSEVLSAVEAKSKANEIVHSLLEVQ